MTFMLWRPSLFEPWRIFVEDADGRADKRSLRPLSLAGLPSVVPHPRPPTGTFCGGRNHFVVRPRSPAAVFRKGRSQEALNRSPLVPPRNCIGSPGELRDHHHDCGCTHDQFRHVRGGVCRTCPWTRRGQRPCDFAYDLPCNSETTARDRNIAGNWSRSYLVRGRLVSCALRRHLRSLHSANALSIDAWVGPERHIGYRLMGDRAPRVSLLAD